jgi:hypothetical protein
MALDTDSFKLEDAPAEVQTAAVTAMGRVETVNRFWNGACSFVGAVGLVIVILHFVEVI